MHLSFSLFLFPSLLFKQQRRGWHKNSRSRSRSDSASSNSSNNNNQDWGIGQIRLESRAWLWRRAPPTRESPSTLPTFVRLREWERERVWEIVRQKGLIFCVVWIQESRRKYSRRTRAEKKFWIFIVFVSSFDGWISSCCCCCCCCCCFYLAVSLFDNSNSRRCCSWKWI